MKKVIVLFMAVTFLFSGIANAKEQPQQLYIIISGGKEYKVVAVPDRPKMRRFLDDKGNPVLERRLLEELAKTTWVKENVIQAISPPNNPSRTIGIIDVHLSTYKELKAYEIYQDVLVRAWVKASMFILTGTPVPSGAIPGLAWGTLKRTFMSQATDVRNFWGATAYLGLSESRQKYSNIDNLIRRLGNRSLDTSTGKEIYNNFIDALALYHPNAELINSLMPKKGMELVNQALKSAASEALSVIPGAGKIIPRTEEQRMIMEMKDVIYVQGIYEKALKGLPAFDNYFRSKESVKRYVQSYDQIIRDWVDAGLQTLPPLSLQVSMYPQSGPVGTTFTEKGTGFSPNSTATVYGRRPDGSVWQITTVQTDSSGAYSRKWTAQTPGNNFAWWAVDNSTGKKSNEVVYSVSFSATTYPSPTPTHAPTPQMNPRIQVSTSSSGPWGTNVSGQQGVTLNIKGSGFSPNATIQYRVKKPYGTEYSSDFYGQVDDAGNFIHYDYYTCNCGSVVGTYTVWVIDKPTGKSSNIVSVMITKNPSCR
ncbi:MAG: hypothetical protein AB1632_13055 [Nitrospirota bacterium]